MIGGCARHAQACGEKLEQVLLHALAIETILASLVLSVDADGVASL